MPGWLEKSTCFCELDEAHFWFGPERDFVRESEAVDAGVEAESDGVQGLMLETTGETLKLDPYPESCMAEELAGESVVVEAKEPVKTG